MAAEPNKKTPDAERAKMMRVLIPAGGIALVLILVAVIAGMTGGKGRKMSDGSDGTADDPGLKEIVGGVKYRDLTEGTGDACEPGAKVKVHYTGWLTDGTVFDSTQDKNPAEFSLGEVIQGWAIGIPGMKPGGIRKLVISPDKGYSNQTKGKIPPSSTLIFEIKLVEVAFRPDVVNGPGKPMSDGSDGGTTDPGLKEIEGGLKYRDLTEGIGEPVKAGATVTVHYTGWTVDGNVFDSSKRPGSIPRESGPPFPAWRDPRLAERHSGHETGRRAHW